MYRILFFFNFGTARVVSQGLFPRRITCLHLFDPRLYVFYVFSNKKIRALKFSEDLSIFLQPVNSDLKQFPTFLNDARTKTTPA